MKWKKIRDRAVAGNISIMYEKGPITVEIFRDSTWTHRGNANVIVRNADYPSYGLHGRTIDVFHGGTMEEAKEWAKKYMKEN